MAVRRVRSLLTTAIMFIVIMTLFITTTTTKAETTTTTKLEDYQISVELLEKKTKHCTNFVFPGKSLCNLVVTQTVQVNMAEQLKNVTEKSRAYFVTPAFPIPSGIQSAEMIQVTHMNITDPSQSESCPVVSVIKGVDPIDGQTKIQSWKISFFEKKYPDPQLFQIRFKLVDIVKPLKSEKKNTFRLSVISESVIHSLANNQTSYTASVFIPYKNVDEKLTGFDYHPAPTEILAENGTHTLVYEQTAGELSSNLTLSVTFPNRYYPECQVVRWPSITMWSVVGSVTVIATIYVIGHLIYQQIKQRSMGGADTVEYGRLE